MPVTKTMANSTKLGLFFLALSVQGVLSGYAPKKSPPLPEGVSPEWQRRSRSRDHDMALFLSVMANYNLPILLIFLFNQTTNSSVRMGKHKLLRCKLPVLANFCLFVVKIRLLSSLELTPDALPCYIFHCRSHPANPPPPNFPEHEQTSWLGSNMSNSIIAPTVTVMWQQRQVNVCVIGNTKMVVRAAIANTRWGFLSIMWAVRIANASLSHNKESKCMKYKLPLMGNEQSSLT